ncbi:sigma-70 family RNA polymerase sigma factor [Bacillus sp. PS06]|uniref:sigma-70 family RNA polymerase sigma factor n=1 Tax=Bacillus sp. PS06 TaxID=2764176 RepID=UPI00177BF3B5|nr:sigma-70 family RNA polymerase sigma factor [Bacillus sp. PS06]MBD8069036.1 sigma-70 family RNA polymerase sigma factor [Bacillus sp. PS06]
MTAKLRMCNSILRGDEGGNQDEGGFIDLYQKLRKYCFFLSKDKWEGEDLVQETMLKAIKKYDDPQGLNSALLNKIAYHHWIDQIRKKKESLLDEVLETSCPTLDTYSEERSYLINLLLNQLTPNQASIYILKEAFLYKSKEIADLLGTTEMAVKATLYRAKKRLETLQLDEDETAEMILSDEQTALANLFHYSLEHEDPSILIKTLSSPRVVEMTIPSITRKQHDSTLTLSMAA